MDKLVAWLEKQKGAQVYIHHDGRVTLRFHLAATGTNGTQYGGPVTDRNFADAVRKAMDIRERGRVEPSIS